MDVEADKKFSEIEISRAWDAIAELVSTFMESFAAWDELRKSHEQLLKNGNHYVGRIVHCHLLNEKLINETIIALNITTEKGLKKLKFADKIKKLPAKGKQFSGLLPGLMQLNTIRNQISHELLVQISEPETKYIDSCILFFKMGDPAKLSVEERIEKFTVLCIVLFGVSSQKVKQHWDAFFTKYPLFFKELSHWQDRILLKLKNGSNI